jgi:hypothetical protein
MYPSPEPGIHIQNLCIVGSADFDSCFARDLHHSTNVEIDNAFRFFSFGESLREPGEEDAEVRLVAIEILVMLIPISSRRDRLTSADFGEGRTCVDPSCELQEQKQHHLSSAGSASVPTRSQNRAQKRKAIRRVNVPN